MYELHLQEKAFVLSSAETNFVQTIAVSELFLLFIFALLKCWVLSSLNITSQTILNIAL